MILRTTTHDRGNNIAVLNYYDNITTASIFWNETIKMPCASLNFKNDKLEHSGEIILAINDEAFLLSDNGNVITKIYGKAEQDEVIQGDIPIEKD